MAGKNERRTNWPVRSVDCAHLKLECNAVSQHGSRALDPEHTFILRGFLSSSLNDGSAVWGYTIDNTTHIQID